MDAAEAAGEQLERGFGWVENHHSSKNNNSSSENGYMHRKLFEHSLYILEMSHANVSC